MTYNLRLWIERIAMLIVALMLAAIICGGCNNGSRVQSGEAGRQKTEIAEELDENGKVTKRTTTKYNDWAKSPQASGAIKGFNPGTIYLGDDSIEIGGGSFTGFKIQSVSKFLLWVGVAFMAVGVIIGLALSLWTFGAGFIGLGVCILGFAYYPWIAGIAAGVLVLCGVCYAIYAVRKGHLAGHTARCLMSSIRESDDQSEAAVLSRLKVKAMKHKENIAKQLAKLEADMHTA